MEILSAIGRAPGRTGLRALFIATLFACNSSLKTVTAIWPTRISLWLTLTWPAIKVPTPRTPPTKAASAELRNSCAAEAATGSTQTSILAPDGGVTAVQAALDAAELTWPTGLQCVTNSIPIATPAPATAATRPMTMRFRTNLIRSPGIREFVVRYGATVARANAIAQVRCSALKHRSTQPVELTCSRMDPEAAFTIHSYERDARQRAAAAVSWALLFGRNL